MYNKKRPGFLKNTIENFTFRSKGKKLKYQENELLEGGLLLLVRCKFLQIGVVFNVVEGGRGMAITIIRILRYKISVITQIPEQRLNLSRS